MNLGMKSLIGLLLGLLFGICYYEFDIMKYRFIILILDFIQKQFMNLIKLLSGPLIFLTLLNGICMNDSFKKNNLTLLFIKAFFMFIFTTIFAVVIGISFGYIFSPGLKLNIEETSYQFFNIPPSLLLSIPDNIISPFFHLNLIQIVFLSVLLGFFIRSNAKQNQNIINLIGELNDIFIKGIRSIMEYAYILSFAATAVVISNYGYLVILSLSKFIITVILAKIFQYILILLFIQFFGNISFIPFMYKSLSYQSVAFATSSSKATLPKALEISQEELGMSKRISSTLLPFGSSINMDGTAIYLGIAAIFFAQMQEITLNWIDILNIIFSSTLGSIGAAGIPSGSFIVLPSVLISAGISPIKISILLGIDRILDMLRTVINMTGDVAVALILDESEGTLNKKTYYTYKK